MLLIKQLFAVTLIFIYTSGSSITPQQTTECCEEYCYEEDTSRPQYKTLGIYTPNAFVKGNETQIYNIRGCTAEKIWMLVRHGSRYIITGDSGDSISVMDVEKLRDEIVLLYEKNLTLPEKGRLCEADLNLIKNWKWDANMTEQNEGDLSVSGWNELKDLGNDYRNTYPDVFGNAYSSEKLRFAYTDTQRTEASYKAFVEGLFGDGSYNDIILDRPPNPNMIQSPMALCGEFQENLIAEDGPDSETTKFQHSEIFGKLCSDVSMKLGFVEPAHQPLSISNIFSMFNMCRIEKSWNVEKSSPWCSVFTPSQFKIIDYNDDLNRYMKNGYGFPINSKIFCAGMNEMLNHLATDTSPKVVTYFGHSFGCHAFLTALGAFKDDIPLRGDNFVAMANRKWKNSEINPMASNIAAVRYNCPNEVEEKVKVKFFMNQKTLSFDWCDSSGVCNLSDVMDQYSLFTNGDCEKIFCSRGDRLSGTLVLILFLSCFYFTKFFPHILSCKIRKIFTF